MKSRTWAFTVLSTLAFVGLVSAPSICRAELVNGDFETGDLTGWTTFTTPQGTLGPGFPNVVQFDTNNDTATSFSAEFKVGEAISATGLQGGGIFQNVSLGGGNYSLRADIAVLDDTFNLNGGLFELLFDGNIMDAHNFGTVESNIAEYATLQASLPAVVPGTHEVRLRMTRPNTSDQAVPSQYVDNIALVPEPTSIVLAQLLAIGFSLLRLRSRRK